MIPLSDRLLADLLNSSDADARMLALTWLTEGYAAEPVIFQRVRQQWQLEAESAYREFPLLTYFPVPEKQLVECCELAQQLAQGRKLTDHMSRCAGKLMEQASRLPAPALADHLPRLEETVRSSKIFFRVDLKAIRRRVALIDRPDAELADQLNEAIATLGEDSNHSAANVAGAEALEALRRDHPEFMYLKGVLKSDPPESGPAAASFRLTMQSLVAFPEPGLEQAIGKHLLNRHQSVYSAAVEALVRSRSPEAAEQLVQYFEQVPLEQQRWLARGTQRMRCDGLADAIATLRQQTTDPKLWLMLLIAELRQVKVACVDEVATAVSRVVSHSQELVDALSVVLSVGPRSAEYEPLFLAHRDYLQRCIAQMKNEAHQLRNKNRQAIRKSVEADRKAAIRRFRNRDGK